MNTVRIYIICIVSALWTATAYSQVTIAPTNLFIQNNNRFGTYVVLNSSSEPQEIAIDFFFGYSKTDDDGNRELIENDSLLAQNYSISKYVKAFPQNFVLPPGQRQVIRLRISPPNDINNGTYWARIRTSSTPESPPVELNNEDIVSAQIGITIEQVTGLYFKKGDVNTGIEVNDISLINDSNGSKVLVDYNRLGNSPFLGTITFNLTDNNGQIFATSTSSTTLFFDGTHRQFINLDNVQKGDYKLSVKFETKRSDVPESDLVKMEPVTATTTVTIP